MTRSVETNILWRVEQPEGTQVGWYSLGAQNERGYRQATVVAGRIGSSGLTLSQIETFDDETDERSKWSPSVDGITLAAYSYANGVRPNSRLAADAAGMGAMVSPNPWSSRHNDTPEGTFMHNATSLELPAMVFCDDITTLWNGFGMALDVADDRHALWPMYLNFNVAPYQIGQTPYAIRDYDPAAYQVSDPSMAPLTYQSIEMIKEQQKAIAIVQDKLATQRGRELFEDEPRDADDIAMEGARYVDRIARASLDKAPSALAFYEGSIGQTSIEKRLTQRSEHLTRSLRALIALHEAENTK